LHLFLAESASLFSRNGWSAQPVCKYCEKKYCFGFAELGELVMTELDITPNKVQLSKKKVSAGFSLRNGVAGEYCKVT